jgi:hypothetical protein
MIALMEPLFHAVLRLCAFRRMTDTIPDRWRTLFRRHGGQCSGEKADINAVRGITAESVAPKIRQAIQNGR